MDAFVALVRLADGDYKPDRSVTFDGDERANRVKEALLKLSPEERAIIIAYAELGSTRKVGDMLGLTKQTAWRMIRDVRAKVLKELKK